MIVATRNRINAEIARQSNLAKEVARIQAEISGTKRILAPSDDPTGAARVSQIRKVQTNEVAWAANADTAAAVASGVDTTLTSIGTAMDRAVELMTLAKSGTVSAADRQTYATELAGIVADITELSSQTDSRGLPYFSDGAPLAIPVGKTATLKANIAKDTVFGPAGSDMLSTINNAIAALGTGDATQIAASMDAMQVARDRLTDARAEHGANAALIDKVRDRFIDSGLALKEERSNIESTDITDATARLSTKTLTLEAAQAAFVRINRQTLFDLLG